MKSRLCVCTRFVAVRASAMPFLVLHLSHSRNARITGVDDVIGEVDEKLRQTAFSSRVIAQNRRKCSIAERFGEALAQGLASSGIITQAER